MEKALLTQFKEMVVAKIKEDNVDAIQRDLDAIAEGDTDVIVTQDVSNYSADELLTGLITQCIKYNSLELDDMLDRYYVSFRQ